MSKTITPQDLADLRAEEKEKRQAVQHAETSLKMATKHNERAARLLEDWRRSTGRDDDPRWAVDLRPDGHRQKDGRRPDIMAGPPLSEEHIEELRKVVATAKGQHTRARKALEEAVSAREPSKPSKPTGWIANKAKTIDGVAYSIGDHVDIAGLSIDKLAILQEERIIRKVGT